ncbi:MAG: SUMF1/EgtB/PvdO family nonheme iron enzyme [bacterium]|nr:SUMF1/EgtB/PvdO family nonheme iron enzyme [bacterium]
MSETQQKIYIKLLQVGARESAVLSVLSRIQGLKDSPERLIAGAPCYISERVPLPLGEKVKMYLEKAGATVSIEDEDAAQEDEALFTASHVDEDDLPLFENPDYAEPSPGDAEPAEFETIHEDVAEEVEFPESRPVAPRRSSPPQPSVSARDYSERFAEITEETDSDVTARENNAKKKRRKYASSLKPAGLALLALTLVGGGLWMYLSGGFASLSQKYDRSPMLGTVGVLTVENLEGAELKLYHVIGTRVTKQIPFDGESARLQRGDYYLEAVKGRELVRFPVYIGGRGHRLTLQVSFPPSKPVSPRFAYIPAGWFRMGNKETDVVHFGFPDESPDIDVYVSGFFLSKYEVTNQEYLEFVEEGGYYEEAYWKRLIEDWSSLVQQVSAYEQAYGNDGWNSVLKYIRTSFLDTDDRPGPRLWEFDDPPYDYGHDNRPVIGISMYEADAFCRWMSEKTGMLHRLPTEAEWEKAARGYEGYFFSYGNEYDGTRANTESQGPKNVASYPPNSYGVYDLTGNAWEWVSDHYRADSYQRWKDRDGDDIRDPYAFDAAKSYDRVIVRGGSFRSVNQINARTPVRYPMFPNDWHTNIGFRYVIVP